VEDTSGETKLDISDLGKGPPLSSFQDNPDDAAATVRKQVEKARGLIPRSLHSAVPVLIFATAGMRLVQAQKARAVYEGLRVGVLDGDFPFDRKAYQARTISGREEGVYAFLAANYLAQRIGLDLKVRNQNLMGVLDLGGSSTQIAVPPKVREGSPIAASLGEAHMYVRSFLSLGMERMRQLTFQTLFQEAHWALRGGARVPNPCAFDGYIESGELWRGTGDAAQCQKVVATVLRREATLCRGSEPRSLRRSSCLPMGLVRPAMDAASAAVPRFFLISGFVFVADFTRWWLEHPGVLPKPSEDLLADEREILSALGNATAFTSPTIAELKAAVAVLCASPWSNVSNSAANPSTRHRYSPISKVPHRCFELNYIITLLSHGYGFPEGSRPFQFVDAIAGREVEWTLGAFLISRSAPDAPIHLAADGSSILPPLVFERQWLAVLGLLVSAFVVLGFLRLYCRRSSACECRCCMHGAGSEEQKLA